MSKVQFEVISGVEGPCLCIGDDSTGFRLAGPKPWGGGTVKYRFSVDCEELLEQIRIYSESNLPTNPDKGTASGGDVSSKP